VKFEFSGQIFEKKSTQASNLMKIRPVGAELFYADRLYEANSYFSQFLRTRLIIRGIKMCF